ncbi:MULTISPECIES: tetratricopeptide repeat protein [Bradyrhizobium]|uniref:tetratricopeptide repeat protein n=1 Tax=Bradyrhizobium TaxID=374 RepID=UPI0010A97810|nr:MULTISPECIES: tetratricopeptide repeat protein [Bradyrhizobium]
MSQYAALFAVLAILPLDGCADREKSAPSVRKTPTSELLGAEDIDPAMSERIVHALGRDVDEETLRAALKQQPGNLDAVIALAQALLARKRSDEALELLDDVSLAVPGDLSALNAKGSLRQRGASS